ncbi:MAG TPA: T9SS type A sorting domain-containing protein [Saprospiraceae bacterium]|nr:T9SS type A sorting domain-containing protein [Saprospiraceae bacterium]
MNCSIFIRPKTKARSKTSLWSFIGAFVVFLLSMIAPTDSWSQCFNVRKSILGVAPASSGIQGNIDVTYRISVIHNNSCGVTAMLTLLDTMNSATNLGAKFVRIVSAPTIVYNDALVTPALNPAYNGTPTNPNITITSGSMQFGDTLMFNVVAELNVRATGGTLNNRAYMTNTTPAASPVSVSNAATIPDCWTNCQLACNNDIQVSVNSLCMADILADMVLEGESGICSDLGFFKLELSYNGLPVSLPLNKSYVGKRVTVKVSNIVCGNSCWGTLRLEDKSPPTLNCKPRDTFSCATNLSPLVFGLPVNPALVDFSSYPWKVTGIDSCGPVYLRYVDSVVNHGCVNPVLSATVYRIWCVKDLGGYEFCCRDTIDLQRGTLASIVFPPHYDGIAGVGHLPALSCDGSWDHLFDNPTNAKYYLPDTTVAGTGKPSGLYCGNIQYDFSDDTIQTCAGNYKLLRKWTIIDWCSGSHLEYIQQIKVADTQVPVVICPSTLTINTSPWFCGTTIIAPVPENYNGQNDGLRPYVIENCSGWTYSVEHFIPVNAADCSGSGTIKGPGVVTKLADGTYQIANVGAGCQWLVYTITDGCGNSTKCSFDFFVVDNTPPVAVCHQKTVVSLGSNGQATVPASVFSDVSHDNCNTVYYRARRETSGNCSGATTTFGDNVVFCCGDVGKTVKVVLEVRDNATVGAGNKSECTVDVLVQDKIAPKITCPANVTVNCSADLSNLSVYGTATATDNCTVSLRDSVVSNLNSCGLGDIYRYFIATDPGGLRAVCYHVISVIDNSPFGLSDITFPADLSINGCNNSTSPDVTGKPTYANVDKCSQPIATYEDLEFNYVENVCYKILRKWTVIDWCRYDVNNPSIASWTHTQVIKIFNTVAPTFSSCLNNQNYCINDNCSTSITLESNATDDCTPSADLKWTYALDLGNNSTIDLTANRNRFTTTYTAGTHKVTWTVEDQCGNKNTCSYTFTVRDCKKPTPYCLNGIVTVIMPTTGNVTIWAKDFNIGSSDNCTAQNKLFYSFTTNIQDSFKTYTCADIRNGKADTLDVTLYVTDEAGNSDFCKTKIILQDNSNICPDVNTLNTIAGAIRIGSGAVAPNVPVQLIDPMASLMEEHMTDDKGYYAFENMDFSAEYVVSPKYDYDHLNGVTTRDIVQIQKHILGIEEISDQYKLIAADVNRSKGITARDIADLRRLILGVTSVFPNNPSWVFVDADFKIDAADPFTYKESIDLKQLSGSSMHNDFVAIKIGDVTGDASTQLNNSQGRAKKNFVLELEDVKLQKNGVYKIPVYASHSLDMEGLQMELIFDDQNTLFEGLSSGVCNLDQSNFIYNDHGKLRISWNSDHSLNVKEGSILFYINLNSKIDQSLVDLNIRTNQSDFASEIYTEKDEFNPSIRYRSQDQIFNSVELYQNIPNPFSGKTTIHFRLPTEQSVTLSVYDMAGKSLFLKQIQGKYGLNTIELSIDPDVQGILYYRLDTKDFIATRKMVVIR